MGPELHLEDGASVPSRKARKIAILQTKGRDANDGTNTGLVNTGRGHWNAEVSYGKTVMEDNWIRWKLFN